MGPDFLIIFNHLSQTPRFFLNPKDVTQEKHVDPEIPRVETVLSGSSGQGESQFILLFPSPHPPMPTPNPSFGPFLRVRVLHTWGEWM